jgi:hypothetical protein
MTQIVKHNNGLAKLMQAEKISTAIQREGTKETKKMLHSIMSKRLNTMIEKESIAMFVDSLTELFDGESPEDLIMFCKMIHAGRFGKAYGKLDSATLGTWWGEYLDKKYEALEQARIKENSQYKDKRVNYLDAKCTDENSVYYGKTISDVLKEAIEEEKKEEIRNREAKKQEGYETLCKYIQENLEYFTDAEVLNLRGQFLSRMFTDDDMIKILTDEMERRGI